MKRFSDWLYALNNPAPNSRPDAHITGVSLDFDPDGGPGVNVQLRITGKVDRLALADLLRACSPDLDAVESHERSELDAKARAAKAVEGLGERSAEHVFIPQPTAPVAPETDEPAARRLGDPEHAVEMPEVTDDERRRAFGVDRLPPEIAPAPDEERGVDPEVVEQAAELAESFEQQLAEPPAEPVSEAEQRRREYEAIDVAPADPTNPNQRRGFGSFERPGE